MTTETKKVVLLGGAFDPIHNGHIDAMRALLSTDQFDEGWFLPIKKDPFNIKHLTRSDHRANMINIAKHGEIEMKLCMYEIVNEVDCTYDTIYNMSRYYNACTFTFAMGMDQANTITKWNRWEDLIKEYRLAVMIRSGSEMEEDSKLITKDPNNLFIIHNIPNISSTAIRVLIKNNQPVPSHMINKDVLDYIKTNRLYKI